MTQRTKRYIISIHSVIDLVTNSSTELFIVDRNKVEENLREIFDFIINCNNIDYDTTITKFDEYYDKDIHKYPECIKDLKDTSSLYVMEISYHNELLNKIVQKYFHPLELKLEYKED